MIEVNASKEEKLHLIKYISKLKMQQELLEIASGEVNLDDIKIAGKRLGKKSQSAFESVEAPNSH